MYNQGEEQRKAVNVYNLLHVFLKTNLELLLFLIFSYFK